MAECREQIYKDLSNIMNRGEVEAIFERIEKAYSGPGNDEGILKMEAEDYKDFEERIRSLAPDKRTQEMALRTWQAHTRTEEREIPENIKTGRGEHIH